MITASASANTIVYDEKTADDANIILSICLTRNQRYSAELVDTYVQWENKTEFPSKTNRYQKVARFFQERVLEKSIPIFAKTMTGELIPLEYHPYCDKRNLLEQLEEIDSDLYPLGSTNIIRMVEDPTKPVEEGEIFALFQHDIQTVQYTGLYSGDLGNVYPKYGAVISYEFKINSCYTLDNHYRVGPNEYIYVTLDYYIDQKRVSSVYHLTEQAEHDLQIMFNILRRDM